MTSTLVKPETSNAIYMNSGKRHDWVLLLEITDGTLNGDPDGGNMQRIDPETNQGLVTDVCIKRHIRNYIEAFGGEKPDPERNNIYIKEWNVLNDIHQSAFDALGLKPDAGKKKKEREAAKEWLCNRYFDCRIFGGVLSTGDSGKYNAGQVRGPMQISFGRTYDPVLPQVFTITRLCVTNAKDEDKEKTMGNKSTIPYGLFRIYGFYNPIFGEQTEVTEQDLSLFWEALEHTWGLSRSNSKGLISPRKLIVFSHERKRGNAHAHQLFGRLNVSKINPDAAPRVYEDYKVELNTDNLPSGITVSELI